MLLIIFVVLCVLLVWGLCEAAGEADRRLDEYWRKKHEPNKHDN